MFEFDWYSLILPLAYVGVLFGSLITFSSLYRKRKASELFYIFYTFLVANPDKLHLLLWLRGSRLTYSEISI